MYEDRTIAHLKLKRSSPHFNDGFLITIKDFRCKEKFSSWCVPTIICNFVSTENHILLAFHFVDQFLKIWFPCFIYIPSSHSGTQLFSGFDLLLFDGIGQCYQIRKMVHRYCILPAFFIKRQNWSITIRYP